MRAYITIRRAQLADGYVISIGDRRPVKARSLQEVGYALAHYWAEPFHHRKVAGCPFCQRGDDN